MSEIVYREDTRRKSERSNGSGDACVEVVQGIKTGDGTPVVGIRDTKQESREDSIPLSRRRFRKLATRITAGEFDL